MPVLNPFDKILEKQGLSYEDLTKEEKELYQQASRGVKGVSVEELREHIEEILFTVLLEHCDTPDTPENQDTNNKQKARLKNYALMKAFLDVPDKVAKALQKQLDEQEE